MERRGRDRAVAEVRHSAEIQAVALSADGAVAASVAFDRGPRVWHVGGGTCAAAFELSQPAGACALSPDGIRLATGEYAEGKRSEGTVRLWDLERGIELAAVRGFPTGVPGGGSPAAFAFSPDGARLAVPAEGGRVEILDRDGRLEGGLDGPGGLVLALAWSPDGRGLAAASTGGACVWQDPPHGWRLAGVGGPGHASRCAFSPDGRWLAVAAGERLHLVEAVDGAPVFSVEEPAGIEWLAFLPDNSALLCARFDGRLSARSIPDGAARTPIAAHAGPARHCRVHPDGRHAVTAGDDGWLRLWDLSRGEEVAGALLGGRVALAVGNAGRTVVAGGGDGSVLFLSIENLPSAIE